MARKLLIGAIALLVIYFGYQAYMSWRASHSLANGEIASMDSDTTEKKTTTFNSDEKATPTPAAAPVSPAAPSSGNQPIIIQSPTANNSYPLTDSQSPNAANGARFAGSGKYQVYRQGNITYRIDTETGRECVLLATDEEWRKPRVYRLGCGR